MLWNFCHVTVSDVVKHHVLKSRQISTGLNRSACDFWLLATTPRSLISSKTKTTQPTDATKTALISLQWCSTSTLGTQHATFSPGSANVSVPSVTARLATSVVIWLSANLCQTTATPCLPLYGMRLAASRSASTTPVSDARWPGSDDPEMDDETTDSDSSDLQ